MVARTSARRRARSLTAAALTLAALLPFPSFSAAQAGTFGSPLTAPNNTSFGCDAKPTLLFPAGFAVLPSGLPSCSWWSSGAPATIGGTNTGYVPTTGTITNVRVKSGNNPAPLRLVQLRSVAGCCTVVRQTDEFRPAPNTVTQVTVNWLTEVVRDSVAGVSTNDIIGFSANAGTGTLPISDQGQHTAEASAIPGIMSAGFTSPAAQPGSLITAASVGALGYEVLLQYDFVPCPALNNVPIAPGTLTCPAQATTTPPAANVGATGPVNPGTPTVPNPIELALTTARVSGSTLPLTFVCGLDAGCNARLQLLLAAGVRSASASATKSKTLVRTSFKIKKGKHKVKVKLSKSARKQLRKKKSTKVTAVVAITGQPTVRATFTVKR